ncbi:MAG: hypothetical protein H0X31_22650 [Nostocaceae cyanobacterium]|nr:hypothetical protein [Nostocaceae cyanobacterium]
MNRRIALFAKTSLLLGMLGTLLMTTPLLSIPARADSNVPEGEVWKGSGYTVFVVGDYYKGCDDKKHCVEIDHITKRTSTSSTWKNNGYTYSMSRLSEQNGKPRARLRVFNPKGKAVVNVVMILFDYFN